VPGGRYRRPGVVGMVDRPRRKPARTECCIIKVLMLSCGAAWVGWLLPAASLDVRWVLAGIRPSRLADLDRATAASCAAASGAPQAGRRPWQP